MGQRLVVKVYESDNENNPLATCYFHWNAYTSSSIETAVHFLKSYMELSNIVDIRLRVIRAFESVGAKINYDYEEMIQTLFPFEKFDLEGRNRNDGLISLSNIYSSPDGEVVINLEKFNFITDCFYYNPDDLDDDIINEINMAETPNFDIMGALTIKEGEEAISYIHKNIYGYQDFSGDKIVFIE